MPCSIMATMPTEQGKMNMDSSCQMDMTLAQFCASCDYSTIAIPLLTTDNNPVAAGSQAVVRLSVQFTTNTSPPLIRPPIKHSMS